MLSPSSPAASPTAGKQRLRLALLLSLIMLLQAGLSDRAVAGTDQASPAVATPATSHTVYGGGKVPNPGSNFWREVRQRGAPVVGSTQVQGMDSGVLIDTAGDHWREIRRDRLVPWSAWGILVVLGAILLFYFIRGPLRSEQVGGGKIQRFAEIDRIAHWFMALVFIFLAITGLLLLFGRFAVMPLFGREGFAVIASASKEGHNLFGPILIVALLLFFVRFVGKNWYARGDMSWLLKGGGFIGKSHPSAGFFNAGEKLLFWAVMLFGAVLCVSGLLLAFDQIGQDRQQMQDLMLVHAIAAVVIISTVFGHIYLSTWGVPGTSASMKDGRVDQAWARQHHDRWYAECEQQGLIDGAPETSAKPAPTAPTQQSPS